MSETSLLDAIMEPGGLSVLFQPIFELRENGRELHALECLTRGPKGTNMERADVLFEYVRRKREESLVDRACVAAALRAARELPCEPDLSLNIHASTLGRDHEFVVFLGDVAQENSIRLSRLIVEIVEHTPFWDGRSFRGALECLRSIGVRLALDDVGLGHSNYRMIVECRPDYFKVDRYLVQSSCKDFYRQAVLESISHLARKFGARVVAEGIEQAADLETVGALGIELVQGHLLAPPLPASSFGAGNAHVACR